jgi:hypothetical protein
VSNIEPTLVLSTANITEKTCNEYLWQAPFATYEKGEYGWWVYVPEDGPENLPADLVPCFELARQHNCCWIMFDCDAPEDSSLPLFDW